MPGNSLREIVINEANGAISHFVSPNGYEGAEVIRPSQELVSGVSQHDMLYTYASLILDEMRGITKSKGVDLEVLEIQEHPSSLLIELDSGSYFWLTGCLTESGKFAGVLTYIPGENVKKPRFVRLVAVVIGSDLGATRIYSRKGSLNASIQELANPSDEQSRFGLEEFADLMARTELKVYEAVDSYSNIKPKS